jgi:hypothetical protein
VGERSRAQLLVYTVSRLRPAGCCELLRCGRAVVAELCGRALVAAVADHRQQARLLMNVTCASSRKVAKKGIDVNVHVEEAASDRELRGLRELRELVQKGNRELAVDVTRGVHTNDLVGP